VITLNGPADAAIEVKTPYTDAGATATDVCAGSVAVTMTGSVNTNVTGVYTLTYTAKDPYNNAAVPVTRTARVVDTTKPVITLNGPANITIEVKMTYTDAGATAKDNYDASVAVTTSGAVNTNVLGNYTLTYTAKDSSNNAAVQVTRTVHVVDTTKPVITLNGLASVSIDVKTTYTDAGAAAKDNYDASVAVTASGSVNTNVLGNYTLTYSAKDSSNNAAVQVTRTVHVVDTTKPVITLNGNASVSVEMNTPYTDAGATAKDNFDATVAVTTTGSVNTTVPGDYTLTYTAKDSSNNAAVPVTRTVHVVDSSKPVITLLGSAVVTIECGTSYSDAGATANDKSAGDLTASIITNNPVNPAVPGAYTVRYNVSDGGNTATEVTRTVNVVDTTKPVITLAGPASVTL
jgi:hypothetical protein